MKNLYTTILMLFAFLAVSSTAYAGGDEFEAKLSGDEEVPPVETETTGKFKIEFDDDETTAEFKLKVRDGVRITQAHLHCAPEGVNGPVVAFLAGFHDRGWDVDGTWVKNTTLRDDNIIPESREVLHPGGNNSDKRLHVAICSSYTPIGQSHIEISGGRP